MSTRTAEGVFQAVPFLLSLSLGTQYSGSYDTDSAMALSGSDPCSYPCL